MHNDLAAFNAHCAQIPADDPLSTHCTALVPKAAEMAARAGLDPMPEGLWPSFGDPRITAIIPMAGDAYLFDQAGLAKVTVPMLALGGTANSFSPYEWGPKLSYDYAASAEKALVTFGGAEDLIFITPTLHFPSFSGLAPSLKTEWIALGDSFPRFTP